MTRTQNKTRKARAHVTQEYISILRKDLRKLYERRDEGKPQPGDPERIDEIAQIIHDYQTGGTDGQYV